MTSNLNKKGHRRQRKPDTNGQKRKRSLVKSSYEAKINHTKTFIKNLSNVHLTDSEILFWAKILNLHLHQTHLTHKT